ncbi:MAG: peptidoglycan DD-metalloendopeptidase family protein, partial [Ruminococcus sp.]|nr:peptidoglycan DD-metalloendopeptidase family protein [Ruminococcus sp.]
VSEKSQAEESEKILKNKQSKLSNLLSENEEILAELYDDKNDAEKLLSNANSQEAEIQSQLSAYYKKQQSSNNPSPSGGSGSPGSINVTKSGFAWPVPGYYYLISSFNEDRGYSHKGIDITGGGIMGATVVAAYGGTVIASNNSCSHNWGKSGSCGCGGGYGNYVLIDHGNGKQTLYGHLSSASVSTGKSVSKGQTIGYVGSTGWSTGAHLHYECRLNGSVYNPMSEY